MRMRKIQSNARLLGSGAGRGSPLPAWRGCGAGARRLHLNSAAVGAAGEAQTRTGARARSRSLSSASSSEKLQVTFVGSGNWGSAATWLGAQNCLRHDVFHDEVRLHVHEEAVGGADHDEMLQAWKVVSPFVRDGNIDRVGIQLIGAEVGVAISRAEAAAAMAEMGKSGTQGENPAITQEEFFGWWETSGKSNIGRLLTSVINRQRENVKYLPGIKLGDNVRAVGNLLDACHDADLLVFVTPHQFVEDTCRQLKGLIKPSAKAISLIKGMQIDTDGFNLITDCITRELNVECSVLMGANIASEVAEGHFSEATIGAVNQAHAEVFTKLFHTDSFHVKATPHVGAVEMCGTLKNVVGLGAGFVDGLELGNNTKAAIMRVGIKEMMKMIKHAYPDTDDAVFLESCGVADVITTCYGGRNRKCAEAFVRGGGKRTFDEIERELLGGQKLQGALTSGEVAHLLQSWGMVDDFPLLTTIERICKGDIPPSAIVRYLELPSGEDYVSRRKERQLRRSASSTSAPMQSTH